MGKRKSRQQRRLPLRSIEADCELVLPTLGKFDGRTEPATSLPSLATSRVKRPLLAKRGAKSDRRMAYVGVIYGPSNSDYAGQIQGRRHQAGLYDWNNLGRQLHWGPLANSWSQAEAPRAVSEGAACLKELSVANIPEAVLIHGVLHAAEHLAVVARALYRDVKT